MPEPPTRLAWSNDSLSPGLAAALKTLVNILPTTRPRFVPFNADQLTMAVLYADAFFTDGERRHKAGHVPDGMNPSPHQRAANGWGYVLRIGDRVFYDHGVVPPCLSSCLPHAGLTSICWRCLPRSSPSPPSPS